MRNRSWLMTSLVACLACTSIASANLLVNGGFEQAAPCAMGWTSAPGTNNCFRDGTTHIMHPNYIEGTHWGSTDVMSGPGIPPSAVIYQTVTVLPGLPVRLTGALGGGTTGPAYTHFVRIHNGADTTATVIAGFEVRPYTNLDGDIAGTWNLFDINAIPTGTQVTISWGFDQGASGAWQIMATHVDALDLTQQQPTCDADPTITGVSPNYGANNGPKSVQVTGTNLNSSCQVILRRAGYADVQATGEAVSGSTQITCSLPLNGIAPGKWNVVITKDFCNEVTMSSGFIVAYAALTNGSFELPAAAPSCPNPTPNGAPTDWLQGGISTGSDHLVRDSDQYPPSCPRPDGDHYGSIMVPAGVSFGYWRAYQYIAVTPGQQITISGQFAGGGRTSAYLILNEGDEDGTELAARTIENREGCPVHAYGWVPASVTGTPTGGLVTVELSFNRRGDVGVFHFDKLTLAAGAPPAEICDNGIDDDGDRRIDCQDPDCAAVPACTPAPKEICDNGLDDDGDLRIDCDDSDCASVCVEICGNGIDDNQNCQIDEGCENCENGADDNGNGLIDCEDPTCVGIPPCPSENCSNGIDDDGDSLIDCAAPICATNPHCKANNPFADYDGDGDVDQADFAAMQLCFTGSGGPLPFGCGMFDRDFDQDVDQADLNKFEACASGPGIAADPACDD